MLAFGCSHRNSNGKSDVEPDIEPYIESDVEPDIEPYIESDGEPDIEPYIESDGEPDIVPDVESDCITNPSTNTSTARLCVVVPI